MHSPISWPGWFTPAHIVAIVLVVGLVAFALMLLFLYINSVLRFVLFDAVLRGDARIIEGWKRWRAAGRRFFVWQFLLAILAWAVAVSCIGLPLLILFKNNHIGFWHIDATGIVVLVLTGIFWFLLAVVVAVIVVLAKDFVVPIMALEGVGWQEGWSRFFGIARGHASEYVIYFLMKIVLRIAAGIAHGIVVFLVIIILIIPTLVLVLSGVAVGAGAATVVKALLITIGIVGALLLFSFIIAFSALTGAPIAFFFPSYAIYFFAGRYEPLGRIVFPTPPPMPDLGAPPAPSPALG